MMDDTGVPVLDGMLIADGWKSETIRVRGRSEEVFISPDGLRYVKAAEGEKADLVVRLVSKRFSRPLVTRFRLEKGSSMEKRQRKDERLIARGEKQREQRAGFVPADALVPATKHVRRKK